MARIFQNEIIIHDLLDLYPVEKLIIDNPKDTFKNILTIFNEFKTLFLKYLDKQLDKQLDIKDKSKIDTTLYLKDDVDHGP
jgi:hypothetical protein